MPYTLTQTGEEVQRILDGGVGGGGGGITNLTDEQKAALNSGITQEKVTKYDGMESSVTTAQTAATNAQNKANEAAASAKAVEDALKNLPSTPEGVTAQVGINKEKIDSIEPKLADVTTEEYEEDEDFSEEIVIEDNSGAIVGTINKDGADFKNLKSNGKEVLIKDKGIDISSEGEEEGDDDYIMICSDAGNPTALLYPDRVVVRRIEDMQGNVIGGSGGGGRKVICLGDSLTAGVGGAHPYSYYLQEMMPTVEFVNLGVGGHTTNDVMAVQGSQSIIVNNITLPKDGTNVQIGSSVTMSNGSTSTTFIDQRDTFDPALLDGHEVLVTKSSGNYYVKLKNAAESDVVINRPTPITSKNSSKYAGCPVILWMGQNGGYEKWNISYSQVERWIRQCRLAVDFARAKYIIVSRTSLSAAQDAANEEKFEYEFGVNYLNLRKYLVEYGLADAGITPTSADTEAIGQGKVPPSLLSDSVHFTTAGYQSIAKAIMRKIDEINMFN